MRHAEFEVIFSTDDPGLYCMIVLHGFFPAQQLVEANFVQFVFVAEQEDERVGTFTPRPNHVVNETGLVCAVEEFRSAFLQFILKHVEGVVNIGYGTWCTAKSMNK